MRESTSQHEAAKLDLWEPVGVARILAERIAEQGETYRWGGDELAVLLPTLDARAASVIAEDVRHSVEKNEFGRGVKVTISCGEELRSEYGSGRGRWLNSW